MIRLWRCIGVSESLSQSLVSPPLPPLAERRGITDECLAPALPRPDTPAQSIRGLTWVLPAKSCCLRRYSSLPTSSPHCPGPSPPVGSSSTPPHPTPPVPNEGFPSSLKTPLTGQPKPPWLESAGAERQGSLQPHASWHEPRETPREPTDHCPQIGPGGVSSGVIRTVILDPAPAQNDARQAVEPGPEPGGVQALRDTCPLTSLSAKEPGWGTRAEQDLTHV